MEEGSGRTEPEDSIRDALEPILEADTAWIVARDKDGVVVAPALDDGAKRSVLQRSHTRLYGTLLAANQRISDGFGCGLMALALLTVAAPSLALHLRVFHELSSDPEAQSVLEQFRAWWAYGVISVAGLALWVKISDWLEGVIYEGERGTIREEIASSGLSREEVIAWAEGDDGLSTLAKCLKRDTQIM